MTELEVLISIEEKLSMITGTLSLFIYTYLLFNLVNWIRRIIQKFKRGSGYNE